MLNELPRPAVFAHRGASAYAPENTISAFQLAIHQKADSIELDVKLSADEQVVVIHDQTVDRTTNGRGIVRHMNLVELKGLDAGSYLDSKFHDEKIPTLNEVFDEFGGRIFINVELTNYSDLLDPLPMKVVELVREFGLQKSVMFSSFNPLALIKTNIYLPEVPNGYLIGGGYLRLLGNTLIRKLIPFQALHSELTITTSKLVKQVHKHGHRLHVYTVNEERDIKSLLKMGVDGVFTDDPLLARSIVDTI